MITELAKNNTIANQWLHELRDKDAQKDSLRFRYNLRRIGQVMGYELSKKLDYNGQVTETPLGTKDGFLPVDNPVLIPILRAGIPLYEGLQDVYDRAPSGFIGSYRKGNADGGFEISQGYLTCPDLTDKVVILADPMLATGSSFIQAMEDLTPYGKPKKVHMVSVIASRKGVQKLEKMFPDADIWVGDIDEVLNAKSYIIPGLGDAGDLAFGVKNQN